MQYPLFAILQFAIFIVGIMESINGKPKHEMNINFRGPTVRANYLIKGDEDNNEHIFILCSFNLHECFDDLNENIGC